MPAPSTPPWKFTIWPLNGAASSTSSGRSALAGGVVELTIVWPAIEMPLTRRSCSWKPSWPPKAKRTVPLSLIASVSWPPPVGMLIATLALKPSTVTRPLGALVKAQRALDHEDLGEADPQLAVGIVLAVGVDADLEDLEVARGQVDDDRRGGRAAAGLICLA